MKVKYSAIDADDYSCYGYYIIKFSSSSFTPQSELSTDGQGIYFVEMVCWGKCFFPISINSHFYVLQIT